MKNKEKNRRKIKRKTEIVKNQENSKNVKKGKRENLETKMRKGENHYKVKKESKKKKKKNTEKKYNEVLKKEGLTEDDITKSFEVKKERRLSKSSLSDYSWVSRPCPISSIKSAAKANLGSNTVSQIVDAEESCQSLPSEDEFFE